MAIRIKFDYENNAIKPLFLLAYRNGDKIGEIPAQNIVIKSTMHYFELSFRVYKFDNGVEYPFWDMLTDFKLAWCQDWDQWFELDVELSDGDELVKSVTAKSLGASELSQVKLHGVEINTEDDIARDDYKPTVLFNNSDHDASLLHRISEKIPHYTISHVDPSIANIQRTFKFDDITLYDALQDIAEEIECIFEINATSNSDGSINRSISVYDLNPYCMECYERLSPGATTCTACNSTTLNDGYGDYTNIFVSVDNLADGITYSTDKDSVKNCFKLVGGDDLMTATIANCNPNGSEYIWYISEEIKNDMSPALKAKLDDYEDSYAYYQNTYQATLSSSLVSAYNTVIGDPLSSTSIAYKYHSATDKSLSTLNSTITGYQNLMAAYYDTIDLELFLRSGLMPTVATSSTNATTEAGRLTHNNLSPVGVANLSTCSSSTANSSVLAMAKVLVSPNYKVEIATSSYNTSTHIWAGTFTVTNYSDDTDTHTTSSISVTVTGNYEDFVKQKIKKAIKNKSTDAFNTVELFELSDSNFAAQLNNYSLVMLNTIYDTCQACVDIMIEQKVNQKNNATVYQNLYTKYRSRLSTVQSAITTMEGKLNTCESLQAQIETKIEYIQDALNFKDYLGSTLWLEFSAYRREDTFSNDNYISDGLDNAEIVRLAREFIDVANKEIIKSATLQHSISATMRNLLVMKEFAVIVDYFEIGNWIQVEIDGSIYRLRIIDYEINYDSLETISVTFSDVVTVSDGASDIESILNQASSMATSYSYVARQAKQGKNSNDFLYNWVNKGLDLTNMKIVSGSDEQDIVLDEHGLLCREYIPITETYDDKQLKIINRGLYLTDDNWESCSTGIGDFIYYNPQTGQYEESYGVIADVLVGNLILSQEVGVYNESGSIELGEDGLIMTFNPENSNETVFEIRRVNDDAVAGYDRVIWFDNDGNANFEGKVSATSLHIGSDTADEYIGGIVNAAVEGLSDMTDGLTTVYYQTTLPPSPNENDIWYNISDTDVVSDGNTYEARTIWRYDGTNWNDITSDALYSAISKAEEAKDVADSKVNVYTREQDPSLDETIILESGDVWINVSTKEIKYWDGQWNLVNDDSGYWQDQIDELENKYLKTGESISETFTKAKAYADDILNNYKTAVGQYMDFDDDVGLTIGAKSNQFKTVIDNSSMRFLDGDTTVASITNQQLNIESAIIHSSFFLARYMFAPHSSSDGGFSIVWNNEEIGV